MSVDLRVESDYLGCFRRLIMLYSLLRLEPVLGKVGKLKGGLSSEVS